VAKRQAQVLILLDRFVSAINQIGGSFNLNRIGESLKTLSSVERYVLKRWNGFHRPLFLELLGLPPV